jgi:hypothetical protein
MEIVNPTYDTGTLGSYLNCNYKNGGPNYSKTVEYINMCHTPIVLTDRSSFKTMVESSRKGYLGQEQVAVVVTYRLPRTDISGDVAMYERYLKDNVKESIELDMVRYSYLNSNRSLEGLSKVEQVTRKGHLATPLESHTGAKYNEFSIELIIAKEVDGKVAKSVYIPTLDVVIDFQVGKDLGDTEHPLDPTVYTMEKLKEYFSNINGISINMELVVNGDVIGTRYVSILGSVEKLIPTTDTSRANGLYVTVVSHSDGKSKMKHCPLAELEQMGLYKTAEEAEAHGDLKTKMELELVTMKQALATNELALKESQSNMNAAKVELETLKMERDKELSLLKSDIEKNNLIHKAEYERAARERDDYYESRSSSRKDTSEFVKMIPAVISVVALGFALFK